MKDKRITRVISITIIAIFSFFQEASHFIFQFFFFFLTIIIKTWRTRRERTEIARE